MNLGIEDACWLAWLIETGRTAEYTRLRHPVGAAVLRTTAQPTGLLASQSPAIRIARSVLLPRLARVPWLLRRFLADAAALTTPPPPWLPPPVGLQR